MRKIFINNFFELIQGPVVLLFAVALRALFLGLPSGLSVGLVLLLLKLVVSG